MLTVYHRAITRQALNAFLSASVLKVVIAANLGQDKIRGQVGHPEYHFEENAFAKSWAYLENNRNQIRQALEAGNALSAQRALGRLTHAGQDLYAHSNYIALWLARFPEGEWPPAQAVDPFDRDLLEGPDLRSGKIYWPLEPLSWIPALRKLIVPLLPRDSHAWMNLDEPGRGRLFPYALAAAIKRTRYEFDRTIQALPREDGILLTGRDDLSQEV
jgi:hypothetical protein